jgi:L,D-transpeptidase YcbB
MFIETMFRFIFKKKIWILGFFFFQYFTLLAQENVFLQLKLACADHQLHFPNLTTKIYISRFYQPIWFNNDLNLRLLKDAIQLLDSAPKYGLNTMDFHGAHISIEKFSFQSNIYSGNHPLQDVLLTDAILTFIAQLHYGKVNPKYPLNLIDQEKFMGLKIDSVLLSAITNPIFSSFIVNIQPKYKAYHDLQKYTANLITAIRENSEPINQENLKLLAINLERWRWLNNMAQPYAIINIPAFILSYFHQNTIDEFKVIVGKTATKTPVLTSKIRFFTTAPNWVVPKSIIKNEIIPKSLHNNTYFYKHQLSLYDKKGHFLSPNWFNLSKAKANLADYSVVQSRGFANALGQIKFNFDNSFSVYLHDTPNKELFNQTNRALSHGCIRVENPAKLVAIILEEDNKLAILPDVLAAMKRYQRKTVYLHQPINIAVVYFTVTVIDGILIPYKDVYLKDLTLTKALELPYIYTK